MNKKFTLTNEIFCHKSILFPLNTCKNFIDKLILCLKFSGAVDGFQDV